MTARKFKLRNGMIVQEHHCPSNIKDEGFIDDYIAIESVDQEWPEGQTETLAFSTDKKFPVGGAWGRDYDIVEELP